MTSTTIPNHPRCGCPSCARQVELAAALLRADHLQHELDCVHAELASARSSLKAATEALWRFGAHAPDCEWDSYCSCGLSAAQLDASNALP